MNTKLSSRKLWVWLVWTALTCALVVMGKVTDTVILWYGVISAVYVGANAFQKAAFTKLEGSK